MPDPDELQPCISGGIADVLVVHIQALNRLFMRAFADIESGTIRSRRDVGRALKAQAQCRMAVRLLLALRAAEQAAEKSRNPTNGLLKEENPHHDQDLGQISTSAQAPPQDIGLTPRKPQGTDGMAARASGAAKKAHPPHQALEEIDRPADKGRQGALGGERVETRLPKPRLPQAYPRGTPARPRSHPNHCACQGPYPGHRQQSHHRLDGRSGRRAAHHTDLPWMGSDGSHDRGLARSALIRTISCGTAARSGRPCLRQRSPP